MEKLFNKGRDQPELNVNLIIKVTRWSHKKCYQKESITTSVNIINLFYNQNSNRLPGDNQYWERDVFKKVRTKNFLNNNNH